jgi:CheY-like chemotaxis protein
MRVMIEQGKDAKDCEQNSGIVSDQTIDAANEAFAALGIPQAIGKVQGTVTLARLRDAHEVLHDKKITFVDDRTVYFAAYVSPLEVVSDGNAIFIQKTSQSVEELAEEIMQSKPDVVLMDYFLCSADERSAEYYTGADVVRSLREREDENCSSIIVGFSADGMFAEFARAGANGATTKLDPVEDNLERQIGFSPPERAVQQIGEIVRDLSGRTDTGSRSFSMKGIEDEGGQVEWYTVHAVYGGNVKNYPVPPLPDLD